MDTKSRVILSYRLLGGQPLVFLSTDGIKQIEEGFIENNAVYAVQDWKVRKAAAVPFVLYKIKSKQKAARYKALLKDATEHSIVKAMQIKSQAMELVEEHEILNLLNNPSLTHGRSEFWQLAYMYKDLTGSAYIHMEERLSGKIGLEIIPSTEAELVGASNGMISAIQFRNYPDKKVPYEEVIHLRHPNPKFSLSGDHLYGLSKLTAINRVLTKYRNGQDCEVELFDNRGGRGIIMPRDSGMEDMAPEDVDMVQTRLNDKLSENGAGRVVANSIPLDFLNISMSPVDLNIIESNNEAKKDICSVYGIHPLIFGWDQGKYDNMNEARKISLIDGIMPDMEDMKDQLNNKLIPRLKAQGYYIDYDYQAIPELQADLMEQADRLAKSWWITLDEKRTEQDYPPTNEPNAQIPLVPNNLVPLPDLGADSAILDQPLPI